MAIIIKPPVSGGGGGAVDSVNGETGVVVLTTDNIDAGSNADRQYFTSTLQTDLDAKADQTALDTVQSKTLYSNSYYVNEGVNDIQTIINSIAGGNGAYAVYMSAGSYAGATLTISDAPSGVDIIGPEHPTSGHICELVSRGLTISGASTTRIRVNNINVEGALLINGTQGRHYFKNVIFDSTVTINNSCANFITFEQCSFAGGISIASNVTATVYFDRCALGNQFITSSRSGAGSPLLTQLTECSGVNALQTNLSSNVVLVGRTGFNNGSVVQYQNSDTYVYDLNNGLSTSFSGSYSELRNKPTIPTSSDDLTEGSTNLFYTNTRFDNRLATKTTDNLSEGSTNLYYTSTRAKTAAVVNSMADTQTDQAPSVSSVKSYYTAGTGISLSSGQISSTITQYTDADADARISLQKGANNGICELDANGLVPTNHLPPLAITDVHVVADAAARLALTAQEGDVAIQTDDSSSWIYDGTAWVAFGTSGAVLSVNGQTGTVSLDTDDISEGSVNQYFTAARAKTAAVVNSTAQSETDQAASVAAMKSYVAANAGAVNSVNSVSPVAGNVSLTTDNLTEGSTNLYYTNTRFDNRLATKTTDNLSEGSTNLYYTSTRVNSAFDTRLATKTTDNLTEGTTNKYFSDTLARNAFSAGTGITITSGQIATTITQYTDALAKSAAVIDSMAGSQPDQAPSVSSVKSYVSTQVADIQATLGASGTLIYKGTYDANAASPSLALAKKGFFYQVSANGTLAGIDLLTSDQIVFISDVSGGVVQSSDFIKIDNTESPLTAGKFPVVPIVADNSTLVTNAYNLIVGGGAWNVRIPKFADVSVGDVIYLRVRSSDQIVVTRTGGTIYSTTFFFNETNSGGFNTFTIQSGQSGIYEFRCTTKNTATSNLTFEVSVANATRTTDDLREGTTNKYFSTTLARNAFSAGTGITITSGQIATTITQYTDALAKSAAVVNSMAGSQPDQAPSVSSVKSYYTAGTGISIVGGQISSTATSASRIAIVEKTTNFSITDPVSASVIQEHYSMNSASATTFTLPTAVGNNGLSYIITRVGTGSVTIATVLSQTISGLSSLSIPSQWSSVTVKSDGSNWIIF